MEAVQALATALADERVRTDLRDAMRASPLTEHKLGFQEYLATPAGVRWIDVAAKAKGVAPGAIRGVIAQLGDMDLYLPYRDHRLTWRATEDVVFTLVMDADAREYQAYLPDGSAVDYQLEDGTPREAVIMVHPAETKGRRIRPQAATPGEVVQEPDDGEISARVTWVDYRTGESTTLDFADVMYASMGTEEAAHTVEPAYIPPPDCDPDCGGGGGSGDVTDLKYFKVYFSDGPGDAEIEYRSKFYNSSGSLVSSMTYRQEGVVEGNLYSPNVPLIYERIHEGTSQRIHVNLVETDFGPDEDKGEENIYAADRNTWLNTVKAADEDCYWIDYDGDGLIDQPVEWVCYEDPGGVTSEFMVDWIPTS